MSHPEEPHERVEGISAVATERNNNLDDRVGREQAPESMGVRTAEPTALAGMDCGERGLLPNA